MRARHVDEQTFLDRLVESLRAKATPLDGQEPPAAILWTDPKQEWRTLTDLLLERLPELLVLGEYRPEARTGPAVWLRCIIDRALDEPALPADRPPIVCLPGVTRQQLRSGDQCPDTLKPLVELQFRGVLWHQPNGSDWTVSAFLTSSKALRLEVRSDRATAAALTRALPEVALTPVSQLAGRRLNAEYFNRMLAGDVIRDLLRWIGDPGGFRGKMNADAWQAFCSRSIEELNFNPEIEADVVAGERLARSEEPEWQRAWQRFTEAPASFPGIRELLRRSRPSNELPFCRERWPDLNDEDEKEVREALAALPELPHLQACEAVVGLERKHGERRGWVWARLGMTPWAQVLEPLARLAAAARSALGGTGPDDMAQAYLTRGWQADAGAWEAQAVAPVGSEDHVNAVVRHLLQPWLDASARAFQAALEHIRLRPSKSTITAEDDGCLVFTDGLRFDLAQRLGQRLEDRGFHVTLKWRWAALPTVTATAKPAVTPLADQITGDLLEEDFSARLASGKPADAANLRDALEEHGYQCLNESTIAPFSHSARGWLETGRFDSHGHHFGGGLGRYLNVEIERLAVEIENILSAGWQSVRVVTDHGWLLLPGGLPKVDLPRHLTESRWSRCAVIAGDGSAAGMPQAPWHWNGNQWFATAPGISCFNRSEAYAHGGLSIQECLIPDLLVKRTEQEVTASVTAITWRGLRCFVEAKIQGGQATADLRLERPSGDSVVAAAKPVESDGAVSLVLADDEHENDALVLVLIFAPTGRILASQPTRVGIDT